MKKNKLFFLIVITLFVVVVLYRYLLPRLVLNYSLNQAMQVPENFWESNYSNLNIKEKYKVVYVTHLGGEFTYAEYFKYVADKQGWEVKIYSNDIKGAENEIIAFDPDFMIFSELSYPIEDVRLISHKSKKYIIVMPPIESHLSKDKDYLRLKGIQLLPIKRYRDLIASSHGVLTSSPGVDFYNQIFKKFNKKFYGFRLLPNAPKLTDLVPAEPVNLMWVGMGWDKFRGSSNYKKFIKLLSDNVPMKVYGYSSKFAYLKNAYDGFIPPGIENINAIRKNGIYLLTHADFHIKEANPSLRLFEAAAANAVIISDLNPFTIEHFGDSVLYFDQNADAQTMYEQVKKHVDWIKSNPEEAKQLANRANKIFLDKFTLERDLIRIAKMHEAVLADEKKQGLSYIEVY